MPWCVKYMALGPPVPTKPSGFAVRFCGARSPLCHVFHTSRQAMIKTYNKVFTTWDWLAKYLFWQFHKKWPFYNKMALYYKTFLSGIPLIIRYGIDDEKLIINQGFRCFSNGGQYCYEWSNHRYGTPKGICNWDKYIHVYTNHHNHSNITWRNMFCELL